LQSQSEDQKLLNSTVGGCYHSQTEAKVMMMMMMQYSTQTV